MSPENGKLKIIVLLITILVLGVGWLITDNYREHDMLFEKHK